MERFRSTNVNLVDGRRVSIQTSLFPESNVTTYYDVVKSTAVS